MVGLPGRQYTVPALPSRLPGETQQKCLFAEYKWGTAPYIAGRNCRLPQLGRTSPLEPRQSAATAGFVLEKKNNWTENCAVLGYYADSSSNFLPTFRNNFSVPSSGVKNSKQSLCISLSHLLEFLLSRKVSLHSCNNYHTPLPPKQLHQPYWLAPR